MPPELTPKLRAEGDRMIHRHKTIVKVNATALPLYLQEMLTRRQGTRQAPEA